MSAHVSPLLWIRGKVRNVVERPVPAVEPVPPTPAQYDEGGNLVRPASPGREGQDGYTCYDVLIDTHRDGAAVPAGLVEVVITPHAAVATAGYLPSLGDEVDWPIRGYQKWVGAQGKRRTVNGYSFAGDVYAADKGLGEHAAGKRSTVSSVAS